jgi:hypothetical protein
MAAVDNKDFWRLILRQSVLQVVDINNPAWGIHVSDIYGCHLVLISFLNETFIWFSRKERPTEKQTLR